MKNTLFALILTALLGSAGQLHAQSLLLAPGVSFRNAEALAFQRGEGLEGLQFRVYYALPKWLSFGPEFTYFRPLAYEGNPVGPSNTQAIRRRLWTFDLNAHLDVKLREVATVYPLLGLNVTNEAITDTIATGVIADPDFDPLTGSEFGVNVGAGIHLFPKQLGPFFEYKYTFGNLSAHTMTLGLVIRLNLGPKDTEWVREHEDIRLK